MDGIEKQKNRVIIGAHPLAGRIFVRAGDGGVTAAKLFVSLIKEIGIFGKTAPDYGPERRGAPVGTNFIISGKELRTQASFQNLSFSIVVNPDDAGWKKAQWRDAVVEGGVIILNTKHSVEDASKRYLIPKSITLVTCNVINFRKSRKVPETITLLAVALKSLVSKGMEFSEDYLSNKWKTIIAKEFSGKALAEKIVQNNMEAFWGTYHDVRLFDAEEVKKVVHDSINASGFEKSSPDKLLTGSEAVAEVWRQINPGVFAMFPITSSTEVGQTFSQFWADGRVDIEFIHTESEHSSFMIIIAAVTAGCKGSDINRLTGHVIW